MNPILNANNALVVDFNFGVLHRGSENDAASLKSWADPIAIEMLVGPVLISTLAFCAAATCFLRTESASLQTGRATN